MRRFGLNNDKILLVDGFYYSPIRGGWIRMSVIQKSYHTHSKDIQFSSFIFLFITSGIPDLGIPNCFLVLSYFHLLKQQSYSNPIGFSRSV